MVLSSTVVSSAAFAGTVTLTLVSLKIWRKKGARKHSTAKKEHVLRVRQTHFSSSQSVSYLNSGPLMFVQVRLCLSSLYICTTNINYSRALLYSLFPIIFWQGTGSRLIDEAGVSYLDTRNNVAHCGHSHPAVVHAVQQQVAQLNTNTRYLHPITTELAQRLANLLPDPLEVVFFCNSGSEANDLALRLARAYSGGSNNTIVLDDAYHGHTLATLEASPYKFTHGTEYKEQSPGPHITKVSSPNTYRGAYRNDTTAGALYAAFVERACQAYRDKGETVRAFVAEGGASVAGVVLPPDGYLRACAAAVRAAGGVYIADEVQTGFGRLGSCFWAFEHCHDAASMKDDEPAVVPDIVAIGKPFGNGMPLAAVVTSKKVAAAFEKCGVEYFNTFGGNPVCAAAGLAVLNVLEQEELQQKAWQVGNHLKRKFRALQDRIDLIGDVRGSGLFLGVELVRDRRSLEPAAAETSFICSVLKSKYHVLTSIDGPYENVLVVKPPMVFNHADADYFCQCLEDAITKDLAYAGDLSSIAKTPT